MEMNMQIIKTLKNLSLSLALGVASFAFIGSATINTAHASSSLEKRIKKMHERQMRSTQRNIERQVNNAIRDSYRTAYRGTVGVASGGILLSNSERRKLIREQKQYRKSIEQRQQYNNQYYQPAPQGYYSPAPQYQPNPYQQYYLR